MVQKTLVILCMYVMNFISKIIWDLRFTSQSRGFWMVPNEVGFPWLHQRFGVTCITHNPRFTVFTNCWCLLACTFAFSMCNTGYIWCKVPLNVTPFHFYSLFKLYSFWQWHGFPLFRRLVVFFSYSDKIALGTTPSSSSTLFGLLSKCRPPL